MKTWVRHFTLVELLTVIAVIAILAGIAIPVVVGMSAKGKETSARADMNAIKLALTQFKSDYAVWPVINNSADTLYRAKFDSSDTTGTNDTGIDTIIQKLTTISVTPDATTKAPVAYTDSAPKNKKKIKYLDVPAKPVTPIVTSSPSTGFYKLDPWGRRYSIALDTNFDKKLDLTTAFLGTGSTAETIAGEVAVYSYGTAEDNGDTDAFLYSWKTLEK